MQKQNLKKRKQDNGSRLSRRALMRTIVYSSLALTGTAAYAQSDNLEIIEQEVKINGLPPALDGFSIGVMSDFHAGAWGNEGVIAKAISSMQQLKPDMITLLGDFVDGVGGANKNNQDHVDKGKFLFPELATLKARFGVYAVLGNHDHWADSARVTRLLTENKIIVLTDENRVLQNGLIIAGVDDYWAGTGNIDKTLAGINTMRKKNTENKKNQNPVILLSHNPDINDALAGDDSVQLVLSGHTHGGQVRVPVIDWAPWVPCSPRYKGKTGLFQETATRLTFISKGVGAFLLPVRFSCPPDIALLRLKKAG